MEDVRDDLKGTAKESSLVAWALHSGLETGTHTFDQIHADLAPDGGTVQMFGRLGYAERVAPSPRWPIEAKILS